MNFKTEKEIIEENQQLAIPNSIIVNLVSLDSVPDVFFQFDLYHIYPELERKIYILIYSGKLGENNILPYSKTKYENIIVSVPFKEKYDDNADMDMLKKNIKKLKDFQEIKQIEQVFFSKKQIIEADFNKINNNFIYI